MLHVQKYHHNITRKHVPRNKLWTPPFCSVFYKNVKNPTNSKYLNQIVLSIWLPKNFKLIFPLPIQHNISTDFFKPQHNQPGSKSSPMYTLKIGQQSHLHSHQSSTMFKSSKTHLFESFIIKFKYGQLNHPH